MTRRSPRIGERYLSVGGDGEIGNKPLAQQVNAGCDVPPAVMCRTVNPTGCGFEYREIVPDEVTVHEMAAGYAQLAWLSRINEANAAAAGERCC
jgi:hypothetical protein